MASSSPPADASSSSFLPADLLDKTTLISLASTVALLATAYGLSLVALGPASSSAPASSSSRSSSSAAAAAAAAASQRVSGSRRFLFVWHAFDALVHFFLEGSFLYHCFYSWLPLAAVPNPLALAPTAHNYLGRPGRAYGPQAGGDDPFARLWMVYAKADRRWAGADLVRLFLCPLSFAPPLPLFFPRPCEKEPCADIVCSWLI